MEINFEHLKEARVLAESILELCEELPERADDFRQGVEETTRDIVKWMEENHTITERQREALENMESAVRRWLG